VKVVGLELGPFAARAVVLVSGSEALVIDPGFEADVVVDTVRREGATPTAIVLTHAHLDHAAGCATLKAAFPTATLLLHRDELPLLSNLPAQAQLFGFPAPPPVTADGLLEDGQMLLLGDEALLVRHCPGHSPGHIVLIHEAAQPPLAIVGDVLFAGSIGRTDLWGGSLPALERSIREVLYRLPDATRVIPGHGPETTIGAEKAGNPFVPGEPA
jgi:hydroxyacylglutathione hydrolase